MRFCYVGHKFHQKTRSNAFFLDVLNEVGKVDEFYSSPDEDASADDPLVAELSRSSFDAYVFWQTEYVAERLLPLGLGRFILAPMYDGAAGRPATFWRQFVDAQFISFSRTHHEDLQRLGLKTAYFQYFPEPELAQYDFGSSLSAFFWERRPGQEPKFQSIIKLCEQLGVEALHVHAAPDMGLGPAARLNWPDQFDLGDIKVTVSRWFEDRDDLDKLISKRHFVFAPRALEGIGMSFLEPMARGQIVVAPDRPTMNEYLRHRTNGLLYDFDNVHLDYVPTKQSLQELSRGALRTVSVGHRLWQMDQDRLKSLILNDGRRWSTKDASSHYRNGLQRRASARVSAA